MRRALTAVIAVALGLTAAGCEERPLGVGPAPSGTPAGSASVEMAPAAASDIDALARPTMDTASRVVATCRLTTYEPEGWFEYISFEVCPWNEGEVAAFGEKVTALTAYAKAHALPVTAATFADHARLFHEWLETAERTKLQRGTLRLFQDLANAWTAYRPDQPVAPDPPHVVAQYFEKMDKPMVHYVWSARNFDDPTPRYERHRKKGTPLVWRSSPQGPYLAD